MSAGVPPKKNAIFTFFVGLTSNVDFSLVVDPNIGADDVKVSIDGSAFSNLATPPVVTPAGSRSVKVTLSAAEMDGDDIIVLFVDVPPGPADWDDKLIHIKTSTQQIDDFF